MSAGLDAQGAPDQRADAGPDGEARLRPGRGRHGDPEPVDLRDLLPGEAAVLPRGGRHLRDPAPGAVHPPHRAAAGDADAESRRGAGGVPDPSRIWGAAKLSGTIGGRTTLGHHVGGHRRERGRRAGEPDGTRQARRLAVRRRYNVLRLQAAGRAPTPTSACWRRRRIGSNLRSPTGARCPATLAAPGAAAAARTTPTC